MDRAQMRQAQARADNYRHWEMGTRGFFTLFRLLVNTNDIFNKCKRVFNEAE